MTQLEQFFDQNFWTLLLINLWILCWKGWTLWKSARADKKEWFIALLIINTLGLLEILYIFVFSRMKKEQKQHD